jgi:hypothetical protein
MQDGAKFAGFDVRQGAMNPMKPSTGAAVRIQRIAVRDRPESLSAFKWNACPQSRNPLPSFTKAINRHLDRLDRGFIRQRLRNRIDLVVVTPRGESQKLGYEIRKPRRARWQQDAAGLELGRLDTQAVGLVALRISAMVSGDFRRS